MEYAIVWCLFCLKIKKKSGNFYNTQVNVILRNHVIMHILILHENARASTDDQTYCGIQPASFIKTFIAFKVFLLCLFGVRGT